MEIIHAHRHSWQKPQPPRLRAASVSRPAQPVQAQLLDSMSFRDRARSNIGSMIATSAAGDHSPEPHTFINVCEVIALRSIRPVHPMPYQLAVARGNQLARYDLSWVRLPPVEECNQPFIGRIAFQCSDYLERGDHGDAAASNDGPRRWPR